MAHAKTWFAHHVSRAKTRTSRAVVATELIVLIQQVLERRAASSHVLTRSVDGSTNPSRSILRVGDRELYTLSQPSLDESRQHIDRVSK